MAFVERSLQRVIEPPEVAEDYDGGYPLDDGTAAAYVTLVHGGESPLADPWAA